MKLTKDKIIVGGVLVLLLLFIGIFVFALINYKPTINNSILPTETKKPDSPKFNMSLRDQIIQDYPQALIMRYHPNEKIDISLYNVYSNLPENITPSQKDYKYNIHDFNIIYDNITNKEIDGHNEGNYIAELSDNGITITTLIYFPISTDNKKDIPFTVEKYYLKNGSLNYSKKLILEPPKLDENQQNKLKNEIIAAKSNFAVKPYGTIISMLKVSAIYGNKEAEKLLTNEEEFNQYFNITLDGDIGETYHLIAGEYRIYQDLQKHNTVIEKILIPASVSDTASSSIKKTENKKP